MRWDSRANKYLHPRRVAGRNRGEAETLKRPLNVVNKMPDEPAMHLICQR